MWTFHQIYTAPEVHEWVQKGCTTAGIGCLECKKPVIDAVIQEQEIFFSRAEPYLSDPTLVKNIIASGCDKAREIAQETMQDVRDVMGL